MKKIDYGTVHEMIRLCRKYAKTGDTDILAAQQTMAEEMSMKIFKDDMHWFSIKDLFCALCEISPLLKNNIEQDSKVIEILKICGIEVVFDGESEDSGNDR